LSYCRINGEPRSPSVEECCHQFDGQYAEDDGCYNRHEHGLSIASLFSMYKLQS